MTYFKHWGMHKHLYTNNTSFEFECGKTLSSLKLAYHVSGDLQNNQLPIILVCHAFSANSDVSDWWKNLYGKNRLFDPEKYLIICFNILGSPYGSTSPQDINPETGDIWGHNFPLITVRDMVKAYGLCLGDLGIDHIHLLIGPSFGGHQAQELAINWQGTIDHLVLIGTSARETAWSIAIHEAQRLALQADPDFFSKTSGAGKQGLKAARAMAMLNYRTSKAFIETQTDEDSDKLSDHKAASYVAYQGKKMIDRFTAHSYYALSRSLDTHHIGRGQQSIEEALNSIHAHTLCIGISSDQLIPPNEQKFLAKHIPRAEYLEIDSAYGHDGFLIEHEILQKHILNFISVK